MKSNEMHLVSWMRAYALPFWVTRGMDHVNGGYLEELKQDGTPSIVNFKRVRVQGRQLFSFSLAAILGWHKYAAASANHGYDFIKKACRDKDVYWMRKITRHGTVLDPEMDLYDTAFIVLGLATYYRLTQNPEAVELIKSTVSMVQKKLSTNLGNGYRQSLSDKDRLRQNPNMHWFEAMLFAFEATQDRSFLEESAGICRRMEESVIDAKSGALRELFDDQWRPVQEDGKILVEPGHHYEWSWLLNRASHHMPINPALIKGILGFADRYGVNAQTGLVYDQTTESGEITQATHRLWVQTEALKAWLV